MYGTQGPQEGALVTRGNPQGLWEGLCGVSWVEEPLVSAGGCDWLDHGLAGKSSLLFREKKAPSSC